MKHPDSLVRIVDDDESVRKSLSFLLEDEGYSVAAYPDAGEFLRGDMPSVPGIVVLDVKMPGMNGLELYAEMRRRSNRNPVVFLTAHGDIEMAVHAMREGAFNFVEKPIVPEKFLALVREAMEEAGVYREASPGERRELELRYAQLTPRERQVLALAAAGASNRETGERLGLSERTVENHRAAGYRKLGVTSVAALRDLLEILEARP